MKKKMNNKGFSLVELIVVIAIMAILAVTLAPRLTQYIEKARVSSDRQILSTVFTAAQLANTEYPLGASAGPIDISDDAAAATAMYVTTDGKTWNLNDTGATKFAPSSNANFLKAVAANLNDFKLKSSSISAYAAAMITISTDADGYISVSLDYDGAGTTYTAYTIHEVNGASE